MIKNRLMQLEKAYDTRDAVYQVTFTNKSTTRMNAIDLLMYYLDREAGCANAQKNIQGYKLLCGKTTLRVQKLLMECATKLP